MPSIVINEIDLTTASNQPAETDIAFVPGLSIINFDELDDSMSLCNTISEFERKFGTAPAILKGDSDVTVTIRNDSSASATINIDKYIEWCKEKQISYIGNTFVYNKGAWICGKQKLLNSELSENLGIEITTKNTFVDGDLFSVNLAYDKSYIYAKEIIRMGIPVVYQALNIPNEDLKDLDETTITNFISDNVFDANSTEGIMDKGEYSIKYLTSGAYPSFNYVYTKKHTDYVEVSSSATYTPNKYYIYRPNRANGTYTLLTDVAAPEDWPANCYEKVEIPDTYEFTGFEDKMLDVAAKRGDCVAIIDSTRDLCGGYTYETLTDDGSLWAAMQEYCDSHSNLEYGTMFTPYGIYDVGSSYYYLNGSTKVSLTGRYGINQVVMPASFGYLLALGTSIRTNANWYAVAGVVRGQVPMLSKLDTRIRLSNTIADTMQGRASKTSINAITNIKPYGLTIWGNRTLHNNEDTANGGTDGLVAASFLNVRNLVSDVKKAVYNAAKILMFEQNTEILWINFISKINPLLDRMITGRGLSNYKIIKQPITEKAKLKAVIKLYPIYAVEDFEVTIELSDEDVNIA